MLKFNEFLNEQFDSVLPVDAKWLESNLEKLNGELDTLTAKPYQNAPIFLNQLRGVLERYGTQLPPEASKHFLSLGAELVYALGETGKHLYIVYDTNDDSFVDGYAQVVTDEELQDLLDMDASDIIDSDRDPVTIRPSTWYAKRDDDAGNSDEY
jgi:hypothetical protein